MKLNLKNQPYKEISQALPDQSLKSTKRVGGTS